jgi:outer membrane protein assembly factor BamA
MVLRRILLLGVALWCLAPQVRAEGPLYQSSQPQPQPPAVLKTVSIDGANELGRDSILEAGRLRIDEPLPETADAIADRIQRHYEHEGFTFAEVEAAFDEASGTLLLTIDEGRIDEVEFTGVSGERARSLAADFAMRAGDVFNRSRAGDALQALLRPTRGAISPARKAFDVVQRNGQRILVVDVRERDGMFRATVDMGEREDWFSAVDGLVPSLGFSGAVFDHKNFNHAFISTHVGYKIASGEWGYSLGFERPLFRPVPVYVGAELYDLTATDDQWQVSGVQASVEALLVRNSMRDYYRRHGVQLHSAVRPNPRLELQFAWRGEQHEPLRVESDFSIWNGDEEFRPNAPVAQGQLNALVFGALFDSIGFQDDSLAATYRQHLLDRPFGRTLGNPDPAMRRPVWRAQWNTEVSARGGLNSDFDFQRHIVAGRVVLPLSKYEEVRARALGGWSGGVLPPQRLFSLGGVGTVHAYGFKEAVGDGMMLFNVEYAVGMLNGPHIVPFFDAGRVWQPDGATSSWLNSVGFGLGLTRDLRVDFGYKLNDIPGSFQAVLRLGHTF